MVKFNSLFVKHCQFHSVARQMLYSCNKKLSNLLFDLSVPIQKSIKVWRVLLKNNDVVEGHGTQRRLRRVTILFNLYLMIKRFTINDFD